MIKHDEDSIQGVTDSFRGGSLYLHTCNDYHERLRILRSMRRRRHSATSCKSTGSYESVETKTSVEPDAPMDQIANSDVSNVAESLSLDCHNDDEDPEQHTKPAELQNSQTGTLTPFPSTVQHLQCDLLNEHRSELDSVKLQRLRGVVQRSRICESAEDTSLSQEPDTRQEQEIRRLAKSPKHQNSSSLSPKSMKIVGQDLPIRTGMVSPILRKSGSPTEMPIEPNHSICSGQSSSSERSRATNKASNGTSQTAARSHPPLSSKPPGTRSLHRNHYEKPRHSPAHIHKHKPSSICCDGPKDFSPPSNSPGFGCNGGNIRVWDGTNGPGEQGIELEAESAAKGKVALRQGQVGEVPWSPICKVEQRCEGCDWSRVQPSLVFQGLPSSQAEIDDSVQDIQDLPSSQADVKNSLQEIQDASSSQVEQNGNPVIRVHSFTEISENARTRPLKDRLGSPSNQQEYDENQQQGVTHEHDLQESDHASSRPDRRKTFSSILAQTRSLRNSLKSFTLTISASSPISSLRSPSWSSARRLRRFSGSTAGKSKDDIEVGVSPRGTAERLACGRHSRRRKSDSALPRELVESIADEFATFIAKKSNAADVSNH